METYSDYLAWEAQKRRIIKIFWPVCAVSFAIILFFLINLLLKKSDKHNDILYVAPIKNDTALKLRRASVMASIISAFPEDAVIDNKIEKIISKEIKLEKIFITERIIRDTTPKTIVTLPILFTPIVIPNIASTTVVIATTTQVVSTTTQEIIKENKIENQKENKEQIMFEVKSPGGGGGGGGSPTPAVSPPPVVPPATPPVQDPPATTTNATSTQENNSGNNASSTPPAPPPATVPGAPTGLIATAGDGTIDLSWSAPVSNGGSAITDYEVQYSTDNFVTNNQIFSHSVSTNTALSITSLVNDTDYYLRVKAVNGVGTSTTSSILGPITPTGGPPPLGF